MNIQELRDSIIVTDGSFVLTPGTLDSPNITWLLDTFLAGQLAIEGANRVADPGEDFVTVTGTATIALVSAQVSARFELVAGQAELVLSAHMPADWRISHSFPSLEGDYLDDFALANAVLVHASIDGQHPQGLGLVADFALSPAWEVLEWLVDPGASATVAGPIALVDGEPAMTLTVAPVISASLGGLTLDLTLRHESQVYSLPGQPAVHGGTMSTLRAELAYTHGDSSVVLPITAWLNGELDVLHLVLDTEEVFDVGLGELAHLVGGVDLDSAALPDFYRPLTGLVLHDLRFAIGVRTARLEHVTVHIESSAPWVVIEDLLTIEQIELDFMVVRPFVDNELSAVIGGQASVNGVLIDVHARFPDFMLEGSLAAAHVETPAALSSFLTPQIGADHGVPDGLEIGALKLRAYPRFETYDAALEIDGHWEIVPNLSITHIAMALALESSQWTAQIDAGMEIAGVTLAVSASYGQGTPGWAFAGGTGPGQSIPIGALMEDLVGLFGVDAAFPASLRGLTLHDVSVRFDTVTRDFTFTCATEFSIEGQVLDMTLDVGVHHQGDHEFVRTLSGTVHVGDLAFTLIFSRDATSSAFVATYEDRAGREITLANLIGALSPTIAAQVPEGLAFGLRRGAFAYRKASGASKWLVTVDMGAGVDLTHLPLIGAELSGGDEARLAFKPVVASASFDATELEALIAIAPGAGLPEQAVDEGLGLITTLRLPDISIDLSLPVAIDDEPTPPVLAHDPAQPDSGSSVSWHRIQKRLGPIHLERVGVQYEDGALWVLLDASLHAGGITLTLDGLAAGLELPGFEHPRFDLQGVGLAYAASGLELGGKFIRVRVEPVGEPAYDEYLGSAILRYDTIHLSAIGAYARRQGQPSLFAYAVVDTPIGGPAFCYVTGLAAGFGYNRALQIPNVDQLADFPLLADARSGSAGTIDLPAKLESLHAHVPPAIGEQFLAVGITFTTFKLIDSIALLTARFGDSLAIDVLGHSTMIVPPEAGKTPIAEVHMVLRGSYRPEDGFLGVAAQLTKQSYLLSKHCHLTGGFALYTWFAGEHEGDFVLTLGGYHPAFRAPAHYPQVPRLGFNWQVTDHLAIKGSAYFALTGSVVMAGGNLAATWKDGNLEAWFKASADFLLGWKPYHYDARIRVNVGVSYTYHLFGTHHITADVGADLHLWGPEFAGKVTVHLWIVSFTVRFGAGASGPRPISWDEFRASFLPPSSEVTSVRISGGLLRTLTDANGVERHVVNPKRFALETRSAIPSRTAQAGDALDLGEATTDFGIASMGLSAVDGSLHQITITRNGAPVEDEFVFTPVLGRVPTGLWGTRLTPAINGARFIDGALVGFAIEPRTPPAVGTTRSIDAELLLYEPHDIEDAYAWESWPSPMPTDDDDPTRRQAVRATLTSAAVAGRRNALVAALGLAPGHIQLDEALVDEWVVAPQTHEESPLP